jgi:hypothetical protein
VGDVDQLQPEPVLLPRSEPPAQSLAAGDIPATAGLRGTRSTIATRRAASATASVVAPTPTSGVQAAGRADALVAFKIVHDRALITYTMPLRTGVVFALLFAVTMGLPLALTDRGLKEHYPYRLVAGVPLRAAGRAAVQLDRHSGFHANRRAAGPLLTLCWAVPPAQRVQAGDPVGLSVELPVVLDRIDDLRRVADSDPRAERVIS